MAQQTALVAETEDTTACCPPPPLKIPCSPKMIACSSTLIDTTLNGTRLSWAYAPVGGTVTLQASDMPFQVGRVWG